MSNNQKKTNINKVVKQLNECLPILIMFKRIKQLMSKGKYYSTLKLMEQIEHTHLTHVEQFKFAKTIQGIDSNSHSVGGSVWPF